jgi:hypothetical protein
MERNVFEANGGAVRKVEKKDEYLVFQMARVVYSCNEV